MYVVVATAGYDDPEVFGPFQSEDECYEFVAEKGISEVPNDWYPALVKAPTDV